MSLYQNALKFSEAVLGKQLVKSAVRVDDKCILLGLPVYYSFVAEERPHLPQQISDVLWLFIQ